MERVCVTGAGGYVASWVVNLLLSKGYVVHGTVRDPSDEKKNGHLKNLENAEERLQLFKADLLDYEGLCAAIAGCTGVLHVASPVPSTPPSNPEEELLQPSVIGTRNVLNACLKAKVKKVVVVSSIVAAMMIPNWPLEKEMDESCWTDIEYSKSVEKWYYVSKTIAERDAWEYAKNSELNLVTVCPSIVIGPMLQSMINTSSLLLLSYMKDFESRIDGEGMIENARRQVVDVRDLAEAIVLLFEKSDSEGRYICSSYNVMTKDIVEKMESLFPGYNYPTRFTEPKEFPRHSSKKLLKLGWKYRPLEESIVDTVNNYEEAGLLNKDKPFPVLLRY